MEYEIVTTIDENTVAVRCYEWTAKVLLPLWAKQNPNETVCRERSGDKRVIVAFD